MPTFTFEKGCRYAATAKLDLSEIGYDNDTIAMLLARVGFADIEVTGGGTVRHIKATWPSEDATRALPSQVRDIHELTDD